MNGFKAFKYYTAIKLHFTSPSFNVFANRGHVKGSLQRFKLRNDHMIFEKMARLYPTDKQFIQYVASNFMYGHSAMIYETEEGVANYKEYLRRRQAITHVFENDLNTITNQQSDQYDFSGSKIPVVIQLLLSKRITLETVVILDQLDGILGKLKSNNHIALMLESEMLRIEKAKGFVKYDSDKVMRHYQSFLQEIQGNTNG